MITEKIESAAKWFEGEGSISPNRSKSKRYVTVQMLANSTDRETIIWFSNIVSPYGDWLQLHAEGYRKAGKDGNYSLCKAIWAWKCADIEGYLAVCKAFY